MNSKLFGNTLSHLLQFLPMNWSAFCILTGLGLGAVFGLTLMEFLEPRPVLTDGDFSLLEMCCPRQMNPSDVADMMGVYGGAVMGLVAGGWLGGNLPAMFQTGPENSLSAGKYKAS